MYHRLLYTVTVYRLRYTVIYACMYVPTWVHVTGHSLTSENSNPPSRHRDHAWVVSGRSRLVRAVLWAGTEGRDRTGQRAGQWTVDSTHWGRPRTSSGDAARLSAPPGGTDRAPTGRAGAMAGRSSSRPDCRTAGPRRTTWRTEMVRQTAAAVPGPTRPTACTAVIAASHQRMKCRYLDGWTPVDGASSDEFHEGFSCRRCPAPRTQRSRLLKTGFLLLPEIVPSYISVFCSSD